MRNPNAAVSDPSLFVSNPGDPIHILYSAVVDEKGNLSLKPSGKEDLKARIESQRDQTDFSYILKKLTMGDPSVINRNEVFYGDFSSVPKTMYEAMQIQLDAEKAFYSLPVETRAAFNHNFREWLVSSDTPEWKEKMFPNRDAEHEQPDSPSSSVAESTK